MINRAVCVALLAASAACAWEIGGNAKCMGGSVPGWHNGIHGNIDTTNSEAFVFSAGAQQVRIPYASIKAVEYGQEASRRVLLAFVASPVFLLSKERAHYVTLHFADENGKLQALVLKVDKRIIRSTLAALESQTGRAVEYQDSEARRFHRG